MHPAGHLFLIAVAFALLRGQWKTRAPICAGARVLADADHLAWHAARTGRLDFGEAWRYFATNRPDEERPPPFLLHRWRVIGVIALAGAAFPPLRWVAGGLALHATTDMIEAQVGPWWRGRSTRQR